MTTRTRAARVGPTHRYHGFGVATLAVIGLAGLKAAHVIHWPWLLVLTGPYLAVIAFWLLLLWGVLRVATVAAKTQRTTTRRRTTRSRRRRR